MVRPTEREREREPLQALPSGNKSCVSNYV